MGALQFLDAKVSWHELKLNLSDPYEWSMVINGYLVWFGGSALMLHFEVLLVLQTKPDGHL